MNINVIWTPTSGTAVLVYLHLQGGPWEWHGMKAPTPSIPWAASTTVTLQLPQYQCQLRYHIQHSLESLCVLLLQSHHSNLLQNLLGRSQKVVDHVYLGWLYRVPHPGESGLFFKHGPQICELTRHWKSDMVFFFPPVSADTRFSELSGGLPP